jgi:biopolymer transport protein ExbB
MRLSPSELTGSGSRVDWEIFAISVKAPDSPGRTSSMRRCHSTAGAIVPFLIGGVLVLLAARLGAASDGPSPGEHSHTGSGQNDSRSAATAEPGSSVRSGGELELLTERARQSGEWLIAWYMRTPPAHRVTWGGMTACAGLGLLVLLERLVVLRRRKIVPVSFTARFLDRLHDGKLDCGQALDHCELNPSPAARVALAAVRRWGRPAADLERAVALAHRVETERLRRNVGTLRRIAALAPLLGLLGTLFALGRSLEGSADVSSAWGPALAAALTPLSTGVVIATLALVAYDGLVTRIEKLAGDLDRLGAETIDAIALAAPISSPLIAIAPGGPRSAMLKAEPGHGGSFASARPPHQFSIRPDEESDLIRRYGQ